MDEARAILGVDTATTSTAAAVLLPDGRCVERRDDPEPGGRPAHAGRLLELVEAALEGAGIGWDAVGRLAVGVGPGGFTGLRIGIASARALAQARGLPISPVGSLAALAAGAHDHPGPVAAVIDARRGEVFTAAFASGEPVREPAALGPEALSAAVRDLGPGALAVGDGAVRFRDVLEAAGAAVPPDDSPLHRLRAAEVCRIGAATPPAADLNGVRPHYCREPDAKPPSSP